MTDPDFLQTWLLLCLAYAVVMGVLVFSADWLLRVCTEKRAWINSYEQGGRMTYETQLGRWWRLWRVRR